MSGPNGGAVAFESYAPPGWTDAQWHMEAIADSGNGYEVQRLPGRRGWRGSCLWCSWQDEWRLKREIVAAYREHERERWKECRAELRAAGLLGRDA